jgi:hypothetical protein
MFSNLKPDVNKNFKEKSGKKIQRRDFIKRSLITSAGLTVLPALSVGGGVGMNGVRFEDIAKYQLSEQEGIHNVAFICQTYFPLSHADVIGTKFFMGLFPTDDGMIKSRVKIVSMYIEQTGPRDMGTKIAELNGVKIYPTVADALTLGGEKLSVDGVIYVGEHGDFPYNRLGQKMYPRMNYLDQIFRVFDASERSVPLFTDKALSYSWLDSMWIYNRGKELNVPMMAGSSAPYWWRNPNLVHPIGTRITDAVAIGYASLDAYGFHVVEILQCMVERRAGGETGVANVEGLMGDDVWAAMDSGRISQELVDAACDTIKNKATGSMRDLVKMPSALIVHYKDGTRGACLMLDEYVNQGWAYAAKANGKTQATEFVYDQTTPVYAAFSYLDLNIERLLVTGNPPVPIERNLLTSCVIDMAIRSIAENKVKETPFLDITYNVEGYEPIRPSSTHAKGQSLGPWPPKGYEFIINERWKKKGW